MAHAQISSSARGPAERRRAVTVLAMASAASRPRRGGRGNGARAARGTRIRLVFRRSFRVRSSSKRVEPHASCSGRACAVFDLCAMLSYCADITAIFSVVELMSLCCFRMYPLHVSLFSHVSVGAQRSARCLTISGGASDASQRHRCHRPPLGRCPYGHTRGAAGRRCRARGTGPRGSQRTRLSTCV